MNIIQIHLICEMLAKFSVVEIIQRYQVSLEKENFCVMFMYSKKWAHKIRKFHAAVSAQSCNNGKKKCTKKCDAGAKLLFANLTQLLFCHACCHRCHCCLSSQYCCDPEVLLQWLLGITILLFFAQKVN